ncbi:hypothetical protein QZH41_006625 [Actinostola sp. cb2023]|nr:hypothetical protein QZH41_006625 [Actinostola sp. cb2023]
MDDHSDQSEITSSEEEHSDDSSPENFTDDSQESESSESNYGSSDSDDNQSLPQCWTTLIDEAMGRHEVKITPGGKASYNGLREGDVIASINYEDCSNMVHMDAQDAIKNTGSSLDLSVRRTNPSPGTWDHPDGSEGAMRAKKKEIEDEMLSQRFKLAISDDGEDDLPPPPPEAYEPEEDHDKVQSKSFHMLQSAVDSGDHFTCAGCGDSLQNQGFIEEGGKLYCEKDYNKHFAPQCHSCKQPIIGPKSLHACVFPKTPAKSSVPAPSSDMLKAIREGQPTAKIPKQPQVNPSLSVKKRSLSADQDYGKVHFPVHGIDYMTRKESTSQSRSSSLSSDSAGMFRIGSRSESFTEIEPLISPKTVQQFERLHHEMTYVEPGSGSMKDKVIELKEELREAVEQERVAKESRVLAIQRYKKNRGQANELKFRVQDAEDKLQRLEIKLQETRGRLYERNRIVEESLGDQRRAENVTRQAVCVKQNFEYEITEAHAARDSAMIRLRDVSRRLTVKQAAIQNAEDHRHAMLARVKMLTDMKEMYNLRVNNIHFKSGNLATKNEKYAHRVHILQDSVAACTERFKRAEKMLLPLKMYANQLQDAVAVERANTMRLSYDLAASHQRLRGAQMYSDL